VRFAGAHPRSPQRRIGNLHGRTSFSFTSGRCSAVGTCPCGVSGVPGLAGAKTHCSSGDGHVEPPVFFRLYSRPDHVGGAAQVVTNIHWCFRSTRTWKGGFHEAGTRAYGQRNRETHNASFFTCKTITPQRAITLPQIQSGPTAQARRSEPSLQSPSGRIRPVAGGATPGSSACTVSGRPDGHWGPTRASRLAHLPTNFVSHYELRLPSAPSRPPSPSFRPS
jgi:hypothetical protein